MDWPSTSTRRIENAKFLDLAKDPEANAVELQRLADDAAKAVGLVVGWHGSPNKFTKFERSSVAEKQVSGVEGFYFWVDTESDEGQSFSAKEIAEGYGSNITKAYIRNGIKLTDQAYATFANE